ncbi:MAG: FAD:protein FMN transferase [Bacteroidales bacterium]|nr:FAD:protein FMN transferase [Bacteroidales bacterium]
MRKFLCLLLPVMLLSCCGQKDRYIQITGFAQGGQYRVKINTKGASIPDQAIKDSIEAILQRIDTTLSGYNKSSQLSRFNSGEPIHPDRLFTDIYVSGYRFWKRSGGALDFAAGPLFDAWGFGFKNEEFPSKRQIDSLLGICGMKRLPETLPVSGGVLDPAAMGGPRLNYNAIAQGYSCDMIAAFLYRTGIKDMLVDIGEIWCDGLNPSGKPWAVGIDRPEDRSPSDDSLKAIESVWVSEGKPCGIVTSGNYRKFYLKNGRKYAHTVDPVSGYPVDHNLLSATVVSFRSAAEADAVATWCMVAGLDGAKKIIEEDSFLEGFLIYENEKGEMAHWASDGFSLRAVSNL